MKRLFLLLTALGGFVLSPWAQSMIVHENNETTVYNVSAVDSVTFSDTSLLPEGSVSSTTIEVNGRWCSLGTSITWYNDNVSFAGGAFTRGYQDRVMDRLHFQKPARSAPPITPSSAPTTTPSSMVSTTGGIA